MSDPPPMSAPMNSAQRRGRQDIRTSRGPIHFRSPDLRLLRLRLRLLRLHRKQVSGPVSDGPSTSAFGVSSDCPHRRLARALRAETRDNRELANSTLESVNGDVPTRRLAVLRATRRPVTAVKPFATFRDRLRGS